MNTEQAIKELAVNGGKPVRSKEWPARNLIGEEEKNAVIALFDEAIRTGNAPGYNGEHEEAYCNAFSEFLGGGYSDAVNSGTNAIYVGLRALNPEPFGEIIYSCINDPGGVMPIALLNCIPVPADTAPGSYNVGPEQIEEVITERTRAITVAHIGGDPVNMKGVLAVAKKYHLPVLEDCSQAHGAILDGKLVGTFGDVSAFSTMFGKHHCTGGQGGVVFTKNEDLYIRIRHASDRGKPFGLPEGSKNCLASLNMNLSEFGGAIGLEQLKKLPRQLEQRRKNVRQLKEGIKKLTTVSFPEELPDSTSAYWWSHLVFNASACIVNKKDYCDALSAEGLRIASSYEHLPHTFDWYTNKKVFGNSGLPWSSPEYTGDENKIYHCPNAKAAVEIMFNIHLHEGCSSTDLDDVIEGFKKVDTAYRK